MFLYQHFNRLIFVSLLAEMHFVYCYQNLITVLLKTTNFGYLSSIIGLMIFECKFKVTEMFCIIYAYFYSILRNAT